MASASVCLPVSRFGTPRQVHFHDLVRPTTLPVWYAPARKFTFPIWYAHTPKPGSGFWYAPAMQPRQVHFPGLVRAHVGPYLNGPVLIKKREKRAFSWTTGSSCSWRWRGGATRHPSSDPNHGYHGRDDAGYDSEEGSCFVLSINFVHCGNEFRRKFCSRSDSEEERARCIKPASWV